MVKVNGSKLHLKSFEIDRKSKNVRAALVANRDFLKLSAKMKNVGSSDEDTIEALTANIELMDAQNKFLKDVLGLSDAQMTKVEDAEIGDVNDFASQVMNAVLGVDESKSEND